MDATHLATQTYRGLFRGPVVPPVPAHLHRAAFTHATTTKDTTLLGHLLGRLDAPADLLPQYAAVTGPARNAYLTRPDVPLELIVTEAASARSATALQACLDNSGWHPEVVDRAEHVYRTRPAATVATVLARAPLGVLRPDTADAVLRALAQQDGPPTDVHRVVRDLVAALTPDQVTAHLRGPDASLAAWALFRHDVPVPADTVDNLLALHAAAESRYNRLGRHQETALGHELVAAAFAARPDAATLTTTPAAKRLAGARPLTNWWATPVAPAPDTREQWQQRRTRHHARVLAHSCDPQLATEAATAVVQDPTLAAAWDIPAWLAAAANPATDPAVRAQLRKLLAGVAGGQWASTGAVIAAYADADLLHAWAREQPYQALTDLGPSAFATREDLAAALCDLYRWQLEQVLSRLGSEDLLLVPAKAAAEVLTETPRRLQALLHDRLANENAIQLFLTMLATSTGTVGDVIDGVGYITG